ncbi:SLBB domain-containing protein [Pseudothermotoga sp. U03pept]|uniref:SLBB domain-containing protein n=1 Tax=Pseudothermotoga sp. U03pept TaxID=3447012 RepID=UPI003EFD12B1
MKRVFSLVFVVILFCFAFAEYTLRTGDVVRIEVFGYDEMKRDCTVDSDGFISYAGIGRIKVEGITLNELEKIASEKIARLIPNPLVSVSLISYAPRYVYVQGIVNRKIDIGINPTTLSQLISIIESSSSDVIDFENIRITRDKKSFVVDLSPFYEGKVEADLLVQENDVIYIPQKSLSGYVKVLGAVNKPSAFVHTKGLTLTAAISLSGGIVANLGDSETIYLTRHGTVQRLNLEDILTGRASDVELEPGDQIYVPKIDNRYAYVVGFVKQPGVYTFLKDEPLTLKRLIAKAGGTAGETEYIDRILVIQNGIEEEYSPQLLSENKDVQLVVGSYVNLLKKAENFVYISGSVKSPGRIDFEPQEKMKMSILLSKVGGYTTEDVEKGGVIKIYRDGQIHEFSAKELKEKDFELQSGDLVRVEYEEFYVYVIGNLSTTGRIALKPEEPRTLSTVIKKIGAVDERSFKSVQIVRENKVDEYNIGDVVKSLKDTDLEPQDTVIFVPRIGRYVYFVGDVSEFVVFNPDEEFTLSRALAKVNLQMSMLKTLAKIEDNEEKLLSLDEDLSLDSGDLYKVTLKKPINVTVLGKVRVPGQVVFDVNENPTLRNAIAKCGGLITGADQFFVSENVVVYSEDRRVSFSTQEIESEEFNFSLKDGDFIYVTERAPHYVFVFGDAVNNKIVQFYQGERFKLSTLLGKVNITAETQEIQLIFPTGETTTVSIREIQLGKIDPDLDDGTYVVFEKDVKNYVYVLGMVNKPGGYYVANRELTLLEVVTLAGGISNWGSYNQIVLKRENESKTIDISNPLMLNNIVVKPGDVVYVPPIEANIVYVLGQVSKPGVVKIDQYSTVLDVIMKSGGFTSRAITSKVYVFKGGPTGEPIVCDLSGTMRGKPTSSNPNVSPGDVIFVPDNPLMNVIDVIPIITSVVDLISDVQGLIK